MSLETKCRVMGGFLKPTKKELLEFIDLKLKEPQPTDIFELIGKVWLYFEPSTIFRNADAWILSAVGTNEKQPNTYHPFVADGALVGTDGHRIHIVKSQLTKEGFYHKRTLLPINHKYDRPKYREILPPMSTDQKLITLGDFNWVDKNTLEYGGTHYRRHYIMCAFSSNICMHAPRKLDKFDPLRLDSIDGNRIALIACTR